MGDALPRALRAAQRDSDVAFPEATATIFQRVWKEELDLLVLLD